MPEHDKFGPLTAEERAVAESHAAEWDPSMSVVARIEFDALLDHTLEAIHPGDLVRCTCQSYFSLTSFVEHIVTVTANIAARHYGGGSQ